MTSAVPRCTRTRLRSTSERGASAWRRSSTSSARVACQGASAATSQLPRCAASRVTPASPIAVRAPGSLDESARPYVSIERTRPTPPAGSSRTASPVATRPDQAVPVTTVPTPATENDRSTGRRKRSVPRRGSSRAALAASLPRSSSRPAPVRTDVATGGSKPIGDGASHSDTSANTSSSHSGSTRSALVTTGIPAGTPRCSSTARCSIVCGIRPSSAAMTSRATSMPDAPATIVLTKSSCPGTSTTPATKPPGNGNGAKLRSIVIPRRRSSARRSIAWPVSAATSADLP